MSRNHLILLTTLFCFSCMADDTKIVDVPPPPTNPPPTDPPPGDSISASKKARLHFKGGDRYVSALASGLELERDQVCVELGLYDCANVHRITLGGVSPYNDGIIVPLDGTVSTTPIAVDRVALAACSRRAELDFGDLTQAKIFGGLEVQDGRLVDVEAASVEAVVRRLVQRLLTRDATANEISALRELYGDMAAVGDPSLAEAWGAASCFAVATTTEALFY